MHDGDADRWRNAREGPGPRSSIIRSAMRFVALVVEELGRAAAWCCREPRLRRSPRRHPASRCIRLHSARVSIGSRVSANNRRVRAPAYGRQESDLVAGREGGIQRGELLVQRQPQVRLHLCEAGKSRGIVRPRPCPAKPARRGQSARVENPVMSFSMPKKSTFTRIARPSLPDGANLLTALHFFDGASSNRGCGCGMRRPIRWALSTTPIT